MDTEKAARELKAIRELMERPVRYSTQSGLSGILAGAVALAGCGADWAVSEHYRQHPSAAFWINLVVWGVVFVTAFASVVVLTRLRERRCGMPFWSSIKRRILLTILPPFFAGAGLTLAIAFRWYYGIGPNMWGLIPSIWMTFYGVACWQVGELSIREMRVMGAAFIASGLIVACLLPAKLIVAAGGTLDYEPYWTIGITFGGFHLIYGLVVWIRHGG